MDSDMGCVKQGQGQRWVETSRTTTTLHARSSFQSASGRGSSARGSSTGYIVQAVQVAAKRDHRIGRSYSGSMMGTCVTPEDVPNLRALHLYF